MVDKSHVPERAPTEALVMLVTVIFPTGNVIVPVVVEESVSHPARDREDEMFIEPWATIVFTTVSGECRSLKKR